jgi:hypothetical protein
MKAEFSMRIHILLSLSISLSLGSNAFAWGERGHDAVSRVATRILVESEELDAEKLGRFLQRKENMLGHLANVPDIVWRNISKDMDELTAPSHFIDMEYFLSPGLPPKAEDLPADIAALLAAMAKNCGRGMALPCVPGNSDLARISKVGHAPFRIQTLTEDLTKIFRQMKDAEARAGARAIEKDDTRNELMAKALLYAGILSHFVGDLANPHHTSIDYDGWETDQGGLHGYFETDIVDSFPLDLEATVLDEALRHPPMASSFARHPHLPLRQAWELALDSHSQIKTLRDFDMKYSLLEKSTNGDRATRKKAKRREAKDVRNKYRNFIITRLATGADALARFWVDAWREGGKPDLEFYRSYEYNVKPELIPLRYLPVSKR